MTSTNQASELNELCKNVYERTGWVEVRNWNTTLERWEYPYTSDFLLEKLPPTIVARGNAFSTATRIAETSKQLIGTEADTPLKALLKLCLALKEAGEI